VAKPSKPEEKVASRPVEVPPPKHTQQTAKVKKEAEDLSKYIAEATVPQAREVNRKKEEGKSKRRRRRSPSSS
jgi:hypothetical protein